MIGILFLPTAFISEAFPTPSPVATCRADCPENAFMLLARSRRSSTGWSIPLRELPRSRS